MPGNIRLYGTSNYTQLSAAASATNTNLVLPNDSIQPGLVLINETAFSSAASISINNCFNNTYQNYKMTVTASGTQNSNNAIYIRLRSAGVDATANYASCTVFLNSAYTRDAQTTYFTLGAIGGWAANISVDISLPFLALYTSINGAVGGGGSDYRSAVFGGTHESSTSFDGLTLLSQTGTNNLLSGTVRIYGYRNSITT